ncbi:MAG TPA: metallophosphoesterase [Polyangiaceae bacterium]|jgi:hypothetical protein
MPRSRLYWLPMGVLTASHALVFLIACSFVNWFIAGVVAGGLYALTVTRFTSALRDRPRPRWVTRLLDEPVFWLWGAAMLALLGFPFELVAAAGLSLADVSRGFTFGQWLRAGALDVYLLGLLLSAWTIWGARRFVRVRKMEVVIAGLPREFDGYRVLQLSDLHVGSFDRLSRAKKWAELANAERPDLCVVTGDLVTSGSAFYADVAAALSELSAPDGVCVAMGNHDQTDNDLLTRLLEARKLVVLRNASRVLRRGAASLTIAGLDDRFARRADLAQTLETCPGGVPIILLAHYPTSFDAACDAGIALVLSGHTHGGQLGIPFLAQRYNLAKLTGQRSRGLVQRGGSTLYVNAGLGTTGPPMRLGVPPELAVFTLRGQK